MKLVFFSDINLDSWDLKSEMFKHFSDEFINVEWFSNNSRFFWDEVHLSVSFLFLEFQWNSSNWSLLDSLHYVGNIPSNLISESLCLDDWDFVEDSLIEMEVSCEPINANINQIHLQIRFVIVFYQSNHLYKGENNQVNIFSEHTPFTINYSILWIVFLDHTLSCFLDCLCSYSSLEISLIVFAFIPAQ